MLKAEQARVAKGEMEMPVGMRDQILLKGEGSVFGQVDAKSTLTAYEEWCKSKKLRDDQRGTDSALFAKMRRAGCGQMKSDGGPYCFTGLKFKANIAPDELRAKLDSLEYGEVGSNLDLLEAVAKAQDAEWETDKKNTIKFDSDDQTARRRLIFILYIYLIYKINGLELNYNMYSGITKLSPFF